MLGKMSLHVVKTAWPFVLPSDASGFAIGAVLEHTLRVEDMSALAHTVTLGISAVEVLIAALRSCGAKLKGVS